MSTHCGLELADTPEARRIKDAGGLVGDKEVFSILLRKLLEPQFRDGAVLDGFPRTQVRFNAYKPWSTESPNYMASLPIRH